jgi:hypothetical protein
MAKKIVSKTAASQARQYLLAQVAGSVAAGVISSPSESSSSADAIAEIAVDVAEAILKRAGL